MQEDKKQNSSPFSILNKNLSNDDRNQAMQNVSKYLYLLLMTLKKLPRYYPDAL